MDFILASKNVDWWEFTIPAILETKLLFCNKLILLIFIFMAVTTFTLITWAFSTGGSAWKNGRTKMGPVEIPGLRGLPIFGSLFSLSHGLAHRTLATAASHRAATQLMAFSLGWTPAVVASEPKTAREILTSPHFANRPIKQSAKQLMFSRAIGFAPDGSYWRLLRKIASSHLFAPKRILAHEPARELECSAILSSILEEQSLNGFVILRKHLQAASLNNIMEIVFGKKYPWANVSEEARELSEMVREGFELLGGFNWCDHLPSWLCHFFYDPLSIEKRCAALNYRVRKLVGNIIEEHRSREKSLDCNDSDFVDVLLSLDGEDKLNEDDMVAILWEMIFRGTDTIALLTEWVMAELVLNTNIQTKLRDEIETLVGQKSITDNDMAKLPYLQAVVKETLRVHPPGPLLSWSRLSISDVHLSNGMVIPANTTAMINMWAITHDPNVWSDPFQFKPERILVHEAGGIDFDVRGGDLRLAPFGAGRRVCPGKNLGIVTVTHWVAKLVQHFDWVQDVDRPVHLGEVLKLSCEMETPLTAVAVPRN